MAKENSRKISSMAMGMMIIFSALAVMNFVSTNVRAETWEEFEWDGGKTITINTTDTYPKNATYCNITMFDGDLTIESGGTLIFNDGVTFEIQCDVAGEYGIIIEEGGNFIINSTSANTEIKSDTSNPDKTYWFLNSGTLDFTGATVERVYGDPDTGQMGGIVNEPGSVCNLTNCKLYDSDTHGICVDDSDLEITGSDTQICPMDASNNDGCGIWISGDSNVLIEQITINNTQDCGIKCVDTDFVTIQDNAVIRNCYDGIFIKNSNPIIKNCDVNNNTNYGIYISESSVQIENNSIKDNNYDGLYIENSKINYILNNDISGNLNNGIYLYNSSQTPIYTYSDSYEDDISDLYYSDSILLKLKDTYYTPSLYTNAINDIKFITNSQQIKCHQYSKIIELKLNNLISVKKVIEILSHDSRVLYAEPNYKVYSDKIPNDPYFDYLWGLNNTGQTFNGTTDSDIDAPEAWNICTGSSTTVVAVIDSGVDYYHWDLANNMWVNLVELNGNSSKDDDRNGYVDDIYGIDAYSHDSDPMDYFDHGTHCAGIIGAIGNNTTGVVGVNWNVSIMALRFLSNTGSGSISGAIECLEYAIMMKDVYGVNIRATSNSWGSSNWNSKALYDEIAACRDKDILFITSAGNNKINNDYLKYHYYGRGAPHYPASYNLTNIISVAATDYNDTLAEFSSYGPSSVDVAAPGVDIFSTLAGYPDYPEYGNSSGTSMSTPYVSGLVALIASNEPSYNYLNIKNLVMTTVDVLPSLTNKVVTNGRINAYNALNYSSSDLNMIVHSPGNNSLVARNCHLEVVASLYAGVEPITNATVNVSFSSGESTILLLDNGQGVDQKQDDGYYSGIWIPQNLGDVRLNISSISGNESDYEILGLHVGGANIMNNTLLNNGNQGIGLKDSNGNIIDNNTVSNSDYGFTLSKMDFNPRFNIITNNTVMSCNIGIELQRASYNKIENNKINDVTSVNTECGVYLIGDWSECQSNIIFNNTIWKNDYGIYLYDDCENNTITENVIQNSTYGIKFGSVKHNIIEYCTMQNNTYGIYIESANNISVSNNTIHDNDYAITIEISPNINISGNDINNSGQMGIVVSGSSGKIAENIIDYSAEGAIACTNSTVEILDNPSISFGSSAGIGIALSSDVEIGGNTITNNNGEGIYITDSSNISVHDNENISSNAYGIYILNTTSAEIASNVISDNDYGIYLETTNNTTVYHNNIIDNTNQAYDDGTNNSWDNGYPPSGGNYWSDYNGTDYYGGANQTLNGSDGIGDQNYNSSYGQGIQGSANSVDRYPMMYPNMEMYTYWAKSYGNSSTENMYCIQTFDGNFVIAGYTDSEGAGSSDFWVLKLNETGDFAWQKTYGGDGEDMASAIIQTSNGDFIVTGYTDSFSIDNNIDIWVIKLNQWGNTTWDYTYGGSYEDYATSIIETYDGYIVAGYTDLTGEGNFDYWILKLDTNGAIVWNKTYGGPNYDCTASIIETYDGYVVAGTTDSSGSGDYDYWVIKLDMWGNLTWNKTYGFESDWETLSSIIQTSDGGFLVGGNTWSNSGYVVHYWLLKLDEEGNITWQYKYGGGNVDISTSLDETSDRGYLVGGYTTSFGAGSQDAWILKLYQNGTVEWQRAYGGEYSDSAWAIKETSDGEIIVAGITSTFGAGDDDCWVLKLGPNGGITFDYDSSAYVTITNVSKQETNCDVGNVTTCVDSTTAKRDTTSETSEETNFYQVTTQATPSYGWYRKDGLV